MKQPAIYMMANKNNNVIYVGVISDLSKRIYQHKSEVCKSFTSDYKCKKLVYFESSETMAQAIQREKQIKGGSRDKKIKLIESFNPKWDDLYNSI